MQKHWIWLTLAFAVCTGAKASEPACYGTAEAAAAQSGVRGVTGFRLEGRQRDVFSGIVWATVKNCAHPERPGVLLMATGDTTRGAPARHQQEAIVSAGTSVTLTQTDGAAHIEMRGIAQAGGTVGDRIRIRLLPVSEAGVERFVDGVVLGAGLVEVVPR